MSPPREPSRELLANDLSSAMSRQEKYAGSDGDVMLRCLTEVEADPESFLQGSASPSATADSTSPAVASSRC